MSAQSTFRNTTFKPDHIISVTYGIDCHSGRVIIYAAQNEIDLTVKFSSIQYSVGDMIVTLWCCDIHVVSFDLDLWIDHLESLLGCLHFWHTLLSWGEEKPVHVGQLYCILVVKDQFAYAASSQHFRSYRSNTPHTHDQDAFIFNFLN